MSRPAGRHAQNAAVWPATARRGRVGPVALGVLLIGAVAAIFAVPAGAAPTTVKTQLSLSGLASASNPLGGSQVGVHPGDKVSFTAAGAPTAGLQKLGLDSVASSLLNGVTKFQVTADFSGLPGGNSKTVLSGSTAKAFSFPKIGTYKFTWSAQSVQVVSVLGITHTTTTTIDLSGNKTALAKAGVKLNASNQYIGQIVVAKTPPTGGLSIQLPVVKVAPSAPVVGQLPTLTVPGVNTPTLSTTVPKVTIPGTSSHGGGGSTSGTRPGSVPTGPSYTYRPPGETVPERVVPVGSGSSGGGAAGNGGFRLGVLSPTGAGQVANGTSNGGSAASGTSGGSTTTATPNQAAGTKNVDLASSTGSPSGQLPVLLAILAVIALAMVAGTYARLYLLGRKAKD